MSFLRRTSQYRLGRIAEDDARNAFVQTAEQSEKAFGRDALDLVVEACGRLSFRDSVGGVSLLTSSKGKDAAEKDAVAIGMKHATSDIKTGF